MRTQIIEQVSIAQAKQTITQAVRIYFSKDRKGHYRIDRRRARPLCMIGPAGIGKTEIVRQVAEEEDLAFVSYSITHHTRQSAIGLPRLVEGVIDGKKVSMTEYTLSEIIAQVYRTMEETGKQEGILFLDEFNCASESMRPIMLQLLQDKSFGPHAIPDGWMLVLAGNPAEYNRAVTPIDPVTADRMRMIYVQPDYDAWRSYIRKKGIHPVVLSYLDSHKEHFYICRENSEGTALVTARGWEDLSLMMTFLEQTGAQPDLPLIAQYLQSGEAARSFHLYCIQYQNIIASGILDQVIARSPQALAAMREMRFDRSWNLLSALIRHLQNLAEEALALDEVTAAVHGILKKLSPQADDKSGFSDRLIDAVHDVTCRPAKDFLRRYSTLPDWEAVRTLFDLELRTPRAQAYRRTAEGINTVLEMCRKAWTGTPHMEFLFNSLCDSPALTEIIAHTDVPEFRRLCAEGGFDIDRETLDLLEQVQAIAPDAPADPSV